MVARTSSRPPVRACRARLPAGWRATATRAARPDTPVHERRREDQRDGRENSETRERHDLASGRSLRQSRPTRGALSLGSAAAARSGCLSSSSAVITTLRLDGSRAFDGSSGRRSDPSAARTRLNHSARGQPAAPDDRRRRRAPGMPAFSRRTSSTAARGSATATDRRIVCDPQPPPTAARARTRSAVRSGHSRGCTGHLLLSMARRPRAEPLLDAEQDDRERARTIARRSSPLARHASRVTGPGGLRPRGQRPLVETRDLVLGVAVHVDRAFSAAWTTAAAKRLSSGAATSRSSSLPDAAARTRGEPSRFRPTIVQGPGTAA